MTPESVFEFIILDTIHRFEVTALQPQNCALINILLIIISSLQDVVETSLHK